MADKKQPTIMDEIKLNPNNFILEKYSELKTYSERAKEIKTDINTLIEEDEELVELMAQYEEMKAELKPIAEKLKAKKAEFKVDNLDIFEQDKKVKNKISKLKGEIATAYAYKQNIGDETPIILSDERKPKQLEVSITSKVKKSAL